MKIGFNPKHLQNGAAILCSALLLAGCGGADEERGPGGLESQDAEALDEAAAKLDSETLPAPAITPQQTESTANQANEGGAEN